MTQRAPGGVIRDVELRSPELSDVQALAELGARTFFETFGHLYSEADWKAFQRSVFDPAVIAHEMSSPGIEYQLAVRDSQLIGYCKIGPVKVPVAVVSGGAMELRQLYLIRAEQGRGVGHMLMNWAMQRFTAHGCKEVYISVWSENTRAQKFYGRFGFAKCGEYQFMVGNHADDEWILRKTQ